MRKPNATVSSWCGLTFASTWVCILLEADILDVLLKMQRKHFFIIQCTWGSVSDLHACVGFRGSKKVEKHCHRKTAGHINDNHKNDF